MNRAFAFVAQISNPPYRRVALGRVRHVLNAPELSLDSQITNLRYSRLKICVTIRRSRSLLAAQAFTFVELLVLVAVITVLVATLLPAMAKSRPNVAAFQCLNNHRQLCAAWRMYADDNRDRIVYASDDGRGSLNPSNQYAWTWSYLDSSPSSANWDTNVDIVLRPLWPYTGHDASIYKCPADKSYVAVNGVAQPRVRSVSMNVYLGGFHG